MVAHTDVAIIGAGPYGLSIAAHLRARQVDFRIFGTPMQTWRTQMLRDSHLKSDGFATSLYEPSGNYTLGAHCAASGLAYADTGLPVPLTTFTDYGLAFQRRYVPNLEPRDIAGVAPAPHGFALRAADGEQFTARRVVVAAGISRFQFVPPVLAALPPEYVSHSSAHTAVDRFAWQDVIIVGAGASALDLAMDLLRAGARVRIVARGPGIAFNNPPRARTLAERIRAPSTGLGPGWKSLLCVEAPLLFHALPERLRVEIVQRHLGPAPCWFTRAAVEGKAAFLLSRRLGHAEIVDNKVRLGLVGADGSGEDVTADHVFAATGYRVDLDRLDFLSDDLRASIRRCDTSPALSTHFESSVAGLYFVGIAAANSFGPVSRFAYGAKYTAPRLSAHLARSAAAATVQPVAA